MPIYLEQFCLVYIRITCSIWYFIQFVHIAIFMSLHGPAGAYILVANSVSPIHVFPIKLCCGAHKHSYIIIVYTHNEIYNILYNIHTHTHTHIHRRQNGGGGPGGHVSPQKLCTSTCSTWFKMHIHNSDDTCAPPLSFNPTDTYAHTHINTHTNTHAQ